jgi:4-hydroxy-4-methyl-2-oxoglutarate aldolase
MVRHSNSYQTDKRCVLNPLSIAMVSPFAPPMSQNDMFDVFRSLLYTPVVGDVLDAMGRYHQFLPRAVQPLRDEMKVIGRAMPVLLADVYGPQPKPFGKMTEALDQLEEGEVWISSLPSHASACWGEILTATAKARKAAGAVVHGPHRDTPKVLEQEWPVFSTGRFAQDSRVRMIVAEYRVTMEIEGTVVRPGDLIFGDLDGVVVIPHEIEKEVFERSVEKASAENKVRQEIENGMSSTEALSKYGVL